MNGILITFPIALIVHFLRNLASESPPEKIEWCEEDSLCRPPLFCFPTWNESVLMDGLGAERTAPVKTKNAFMCKEIISMPSLQSLENKNKECLGILAILEPRLAASLEYVEACVFLRNLVLHVLRTLSAVPALSCPNEALRQVDFHIDRHDEPFL